MSDDTPRPDACPSIRVWAFAEAPAELQGLSDNCGDEDWLALVPAHLVDRWIPWLEAGHGGFGAYRVDQYPRPDGSVVRIGSHG